MLSRILLACLMMWSLTACAITPNDSAICVGTETSRKALVAALLTDGGPQAQRAGLLVLDQMRAGCGPWTLLAFWGSWWRIAAVYGLALPWLDGR